MLHPAYLTAVHAGPDNDSDEGRLVVRRALPALVFGRTSGNVLIRFPYVFLTSIARGLGIQIDTATTILGVRELGGLATPVIGHVADRGHERRVIVGCCVIAGLATMAAPFVGGIWVFGILMFLGGIAKFGSDTAQGAWVGHRVPYARRGRVLGLMEVSWAGAFLVGMPICAWLISVWGWRGPFVGTGIALVVAGLVQWVRLPPDEVEVASDRAPMRFRIPRELRGVMVFAALQPFAQMMVFAVAGDWFVSDLGMSLAGLGINTVLLGLAELAGTGIAAIASDRLGKRRTAMAGAVVAIPLSAVLGFTGGSALIGVSALVLMDVAIELAFVAVLPLITELDPEARASAIGVAMAVVTSSRAISSILAGVVYVNWGMEANGLLASLAMVGCFLALWRWVKEPKPLAGVVA